MTCWMNFLLIYVNSLYIIHAILGFAKYSKLDLCKHRFNLLDISDRDEREID